MPRPWSARAIIAAAGIAAAACTTPPPDAGPAGPLPAATLPGWRSDTLEGAADMIARQCALASPPAPWPGLCAEFAALPADGLAADGLRAWLESRFDAWALRDERGGSQGLITGYYEPLLTGSRTRESDRQVPLYARPPDLLTIDLSAVEPRLAGMRLRGRLQGDRVVPYHSRAQIENALALTGNELLWVDDPIDAFFLEIQGSGRVRLRDGTLVRVGYADQNGHPYRAIGRSLIDRGALVPSEVSAPAIKGWLRDNPTQAAQVMQSNPSQVFFRELPPTPPTVAGRTEPGPPGSMGVPLTPGRSLAVDRAVVPLGSLVFVDTEHPVTAAPIRRVMGAQDTGGAIAGQVRADYFWGFGPEAELAAGLMKARGRLWVLWPKGQAFPAAARSR